MGKKEKKKMKKILKRIEDYIGDKGYDTKGVVVFAILLFLAIVFSTFIFFSVYEYIPGWVEKDLSELKVLDIIILLFVWKVFK